MKKLTALFSLLCLTLALTVPASALEYDIDGPGDPEYGKDTSIEIVHTADGGAMKNEDVSKNAALMGHPSARIHAGIRTFEEAIAANEAMGVTKAQEAAMMFGCIYGWEKPGADPKNYDDQGQPIKPRHRDRGDAR